MINKIMIPVRVVCVVGVLALFAHANAIRASVNLGNGPADAPANNGMPCQAGLCLPSGATTPPVDNEPHMAYTLPQPNEILNPVTSEGDAVKIIRSTSPAPAPIPSPSGAVSVEDVLNKNLNADTAHPTAPSTGSAKLVTGINPDDAMLSRSKPAKSGNLELPDDFGLGISEGPSVVY